MLSGDKRLTLCQRLRQQHATPVIMLTAMGELSDRVLGQGLSAARAVVAIQDQSKQNSTSPSTGS